MSSISDMMAAFDERMRTLESRFDDLGYGVKSLVQSEVRKKWIVQPQSETLYGVYTALVVDTLDYWGENRVRFFTPLLHDPNTDVKSLPWASPISPFGGFDDCGVNWVPPAGSTICIVFENGNVKSPYYFGTIWSRSRGDANNHPWRVNVDEYYKLHEGHRTGYVVGKNDGSQNFSPWNTESYKKFDINSRVDFDTEPNAEKKMTYPHIYGCKTPQKGMWKFVDGDYNCNFRGKRLEVQTPLGQAFLMKDDMFNPAGHWGNPKLCDPCPFDPTSESSNSSSGEFDCDDDKGECTKDVDKKETCKNIFFKNSSEARPIRGPGTPQNNKYAVPQVGIQILSFAGTSFVMDDSVEEPRGTLGWERSQECFDYGCTNLFTGKTFWCSSTGHEILMNDKEEKSGLRGEDNGIRILSANGNMIFLRDHTTGQEDCKDCGPNVAGNKRGILIQSTALNQIELNDGENEQCAPCRKAGGQAKPKAKRAFINMRTGYGIEVSLNDYDRDRDVAGSQEKTVNQNFKIFCPQRDNTKRGPHILRFQEVPDGPGQMLIKVGGDYICTTFDNHLTEVGSEENPGNLEFKVSQDSVIETKGTHLNIADQIVMFSEKQMLLLAGRDCPPSEDEGSDGKNTPCLCPVLCLDQSNGQIKISDRVFVTTSPDSQQASVFSMKII